jgi:putative membrane protein
MQGLPRRARPLLARLGEAMPHTLGPAGIWIVALVHGAAFWLWHDPQLFDAALRHGAVHTLEHATFVVTALVYWWTIVHAAEAGDNGYVLAMLASVATMIQGSVLGLVMLVATSPWYTVSGTTGDAVSQQQGAAALMWAITGTVYMLAAAVLLWRFVEDAERRTA